MLSTALQALDRHRNKVTIVLLVLALAGAGAWAQRSLDRRPLVVAPGEPPPAVGSIRVQVAGAVLSPGVYVLTAGDRVSEAVDAAGGPAPNADVDSLNLAAKVKDEMRVVVPTARMPASSARAGTPSAAGSGRQAGPIDLNRAGEADLESLPGIGPATAGKILDYRARNGPFRTVVELLAAKLVSASTLERIRPLVVVR